MQTETTVKYCCTIRIAKILFQIVKTLAPVKAGEDIECQEIS